MSGPEDEPTVPGRALSQIRSMAAFTAWLAFCAGLTGVLAFDWGAGEVVAAAAIGVVLLAPVAYVVGRKRRWVPEDGQMPAEADTESSTRPPREETRNLLGAIAIGALVAGLMIALGTFLDFETSAVIGVFLGDAIADLYASSKVAAWERRTGRVLLTIDPWAAEGARKFFVAPVGTPV